MEYHASILNGKKPNDIKPEELKDVWFMPSVWDIGYNHYINRKKLSQKILIETEILLKSKNNRPEKLTFNWGPAWIHYMSN
jgi:hypothetical protein